MVPPMRTESGCYRPGCTRHTCRISGDDPRHGTYNGYTNLGCGCAECRTAASEQARKAKARRATEEPPHWVHGTANGYGNWGCRCPDCTAAWRRNRQEERSNRSTG